MSHKEKKHTHKKDEKHQATPMDDLNDIDDATDSDEQPDIKTIQFDASPQETPEILRDKADKYDALSEKYVRLIAEYDNFRKRVTKEKELIYRTANEGIMKEILPVLDNLDRATEHRNNETSMDEYVEGIAIIEEQLRSVLAQAGLESIEVVGQPFDPNIHDAVMQMETEDHEPGTVAQEVQKGYTLSGHVIRHSKVVVSK